MERATTFKGSLDAPTTDTLFSPSGIFHGWGWNEQGERILSVRARINQRRIVRGIYGIPRPDLKKKFDEAPQAFCSGFLLHLIFLHKENHVTIEFLTKSKGWVVGFQRRMICRRPLSRKAFLWWHLLSLIPLGKFSEEIVGRKFPRLYLKRIAFHKREYFHWSDVKSRFEAGKPRAFRMRRLTGWGFHWKRVGASTHLRLRCGSGHILKTFEVLGGMPWKAVAEAYPHISDAGMSMYTSMFPMAVFRQRLYLEVWKPRVGWVCLQKFVEEASFGGLTSQGLCEWKRVYQLPLDLLEQKARIWLKRAKESCLSEKKRRFYLRARLAIRRLAWIRRAYPHYVFLSHGDAYRGPFKSFPHRFSWVYLNGWIFADPHLGMRVRITGNDQRKIGNLIGTWFWRCLWGWVRWGIPREDVADYLGYSPESHRSGFFALVKIPEGCSVLTLEVWTHHFGWTPVFRRRVTCVHPEGLLFSSSGEISEAARHPSPWARWKIFFQIWKSDFSAAWDSLHRGQQVWLYGQLERFRLCRVMELAQYKPRRITFDRLPSLPPSSSLPRITVVTPSYNQADFLQVTIDSVLADKRVPVDYIIQDGGSTDRSPEIIASVSAQLKHGESAPDKGQADAIRRGFERAHCSADDVMAYLNSDDFFAPGALWFVAHYFAMHPDVDVLYGYRLMVDEKGRETGRWITPKPHRETLYYLDAVPQETLFWRKRIYDRVGGIDPDFRFALDWDLLLRFADAGAKMVRVPWFLGCFRVHPAQKTSAQMGSIGKEETELLRRRSLGRELSYGELSLYMEKIRAESGLWNLFRTRR